MFRHFFLTTLIFLLSATALIFTILGLDPLGPDPWMALSVFSVSLFLTVSSFGTFLFFFGAEVFSPSFFHQFPEKTQFGIALRRGMLLAVFLLLVAGLQMIRLFGILEGILLLVFFVVVELIFLSSQVQKRV
ncbi:MAG: hypothetical protein K9M51_03540 [Candidatus Gracilibacteria bacterium]|nr:hypothetical protein [Candidatus Gracilibacteria bacterium]